MNIVISLIAFFFFQTATPPDYAGPLSDREKARLRAIENPHFVALSDSQKVEMRTNAHADVEKAHPGYKWHESTGPSDKAGIVPVPGGSAQ